MKLSFLGDLHFGIRNDSEYFYTYQYNFFVDVYIPYLVKHGIKTIIQVGDFFDRRQYINFKTYYFLHNFLPKLLTDNDIQMYVLIGNHDTALKSSNHINSPKLLLSHIPNITVIDTLSELKLKEGNEEFDIAIIPWINNSNYQESVDFINNTKCQYVAGHFELAGFEMHKGYVNDSGMSTDIFDRFTQVITGHYHTQSKKGNIQYTGTPYELTWSDWNDQKVFWVLDTNTYVLESVPNPNIMFHKVEYYQKNKDIFITTTPPTDILTNKYIKLVCVKKEDDRSFEDYVKTVLAQNPIDVNVILNSIDLPDTMEELEKNSTKSITQLIVDNINKIDLENVTGDVETLKYDTIKFLLTVYAETGGKHD